MNPKENPISDEQQSRLEQDLFDRAKNVKPEDEQGIAEELPHKMAKILNSINERLPVVKNMIDKVKTLYAMMRDKDFAMAWSSKTIVIAGLLYFISPVDFLPDFIPILGYVDDAFVISLVINTLSAEIERYQQYVASAFAPKSSDILPAKS
jgi:uncharacterized membrane protein YkvA (DUF1232 family)